MRQKNALRADSLDEVGLAEFVNRKDCKNHLGAELPSGFLFEEAFDGFFDIGAVGETAQFFYCCADKLSDF